MEISSSDIVHFEFTMKFAPLWILLIAFHLFMKEQIEIRQKGDDFPENGDAGL